MFESSLGQPLHRKGHTFVNRFIVRLVEISQRHARLVMAAAALVTLVLGFFALRIRANPDIANLIPQDARVTRLLQKYGAQSSDTDFLIIIAEAPDIFSLPKLTALDRAYRAIETIPTVSAGVTPFSFITFAKSGTRLAFAALSGGQAAPATEEALETFKRKIASDPLARNLVISADGTSLCAIFPVKIQDDYGEVLASVERIIDPVKPGMDIRIAGALPYNRAVLTHLSTDLPIFLAVSLAIILISYYLSFRTLRSLILPVLVVVLGTVWTIGAMQILGFKITVIQIMTPPLVLILGSAYSIHVLNQYYRESRTSGTDKHWIVDSVGHINTTIFLASSTTVFGFASLLTASLRQLREFGIATSIGIAFCAVLALFFLPAALSLLSPPTAVQRNRVLEGFITRHMGRLADTIMRMRFLVLGAALAILVAFVFSLGGVRYETDFTRYFRSTEKAVEDNRRLVEKFGGFVTLNYSLAAPQGAAGYFLDPAVLREISRFEDRLAADADIPYVSSFSTYVKAMNAAMTGNAEVPETRPLILLLSRYFGALAGTPMGKNVTGVFLNKDFSRYTVVVRVFDSKNNNIAFESQIRKIIGRIQSTARETLPAGLTGEFWGPTISILYLSDVLTWNQISSILSSAVLVFLISALVFRSAKLGLLVLAPLASGIMLTFIVMAVFSIPLDVVTITFASIAIGIGVDNAIHLAIQYRRQRKIYPLDAEKTIEHTLKIGGRPMLLTTLSIVAALLVFVFSSFRPVLYFGILISVSLFMTTAGALLLLPVLLYFDARRQVRKARLAEKPEAKSAVG
jgi:hydrophobe/amphiphile efflux-3 (HAE3) family protein